MDQPESPIKHGRDNIQLGPTTFQSGVEYVMTAKEYEQAYEHQPSWPPKFVQPPSDPLVNDIYGFMSFINMRLSNIERTLDYLALPWYKRLMIWAKRVFHV